MFSMRYQRFRMKECARRRARLRGLRLAFFVAGTLLPVLAAPPPASAQNNALDEAGALLALPLFTAGDAALNVSHAWDHVVPPVVTALTVTNAGPEALLHVVVVSGDSEDRWLGQDFDCRLTANETALFVFEPDEDGRGSLLSYECHDDQFAKLPFKASRGVVVVTLADPGSGATLNANQIFGDATILDFGLGSAVSLAAVAFQGVALTPGVADRQHRFDNLEYSSFPSALGTNFLAPVAGRVKAQLILFTLDGTVGSAQPPPVSVAIDFYNDDEVRGSTSHHFECFDIVSLTEIDGRFEADALGSPAGHLLLAPQIVTYPDLAHDALFDGGGPVGVRKPPVHGWLVQTLFRRGAPAGIEGVSESRAQWGRSLAQSQLPLVPFEGDTPVLYAP
jgi:hypothetical protein